LQTGRRFRRTPLTSPAGLEVQLEATLRTVIQAAVKAQKAGQAIARMPPLEWAWISSAFVLQSMVVSTMLCEDRPEACPWSFYILRLSV
jgi:hypothetical protein